jgi:hypothetical protein
MVSIMGKLVLWQILMKIQLGQEAEVFVVKDVVREDGLVGEAEQEQGVRLTKLLLLLLWYLQSSLGLIRMSHLQFYENVADFAETSQDTVTAIRFLSGRSVILTYSMGLN